MKTKQIILAGILILAGLGLGNAQVGTNGVSALLQKGLFEEEANHNLEAAITAYQAVVTQTEKDRQFAATAIFRLGECYRKLGRTNEANVQYQRILREFPDQTELAKLSEGYAGAKAASGADGSKPPVDFSTAMEDGEINRIRAMIKDSPDLINAPVDSAGSTPLFGAAQNGQAKVVKFLLENKADPNFRNKVGSTPLLVAAQAGRKEVVESLLNGGADINAADSKTRDTALHLAAARGYKGVAEVLLAHGMNPDVRDGAQETPLFDACGYGFKAVAELLVQKGADVNAAASSGTPLHRAASAGNNAIIEWLLSNKANVNSKAQDGMTPLMSASKENHLEAARLLLAHGADVRAQIVNNNADKANWTALHWAVNWDENDLLGLLLDNKADPNAAVGTYRTVQIPEYNSLSSNVRGVTPLLTAIYRNQPEAAKILLNHGADPNLKSATDAMPLMEAVRINRAMVTMLLDSKADPNLRSQNKRTPLHQAVDNRDMATAELLLSRGADANAKDFRGMSPLHYAASYNSKELVDLLIANKADVNLKNDEGETALDLNTKAVGETNPRAVGGFPGNIPPPAPLTPPPLSSQWNNGQPQSQAASPIDAVSTALREHGGIGALERSTIRLSMPGSRSPYVIFRSDSKGLNRFTLLEAIRAAYNPGGPAFPDFGNVTIRRGGTNAGAAGSVHVDLLNGTNGFDCAKDVPLEFGDVVEIPERVHALSEGWSGLGRYQMESLNSCTIKRLKVVVRGEPKDIVIQSGTYLSSLMNYDDVRRVLLSTSDLTRLTVKRIDPVTKRSREILVNAREAKSANEDLWPRDGDVIEVPDKS